MSIGPEVRRGGNLPFGMFAAQWMCDCRYSTNARTLYGILITYADTQDRTTAKGKPYRSALARQLGVSLATLDRTLLELEVGGMVRIEPRKDPDNPLQNEANIYHLLDAPLMWQGNGAWVDPLGPDVKAADVAKAVTEARRAEKRDAGVVRKGGVAKGISTKAVKAAREAAGSEEGGGSTHAATPGSTHAARVAAPVLPFIQSPVQTPSPDPDAPSGRSPAGCRQASTGSKGSRGGGSAASATSKPRFSQQQRDQVQAVRALLPQELNKVLGDKLPTNVSHAIIEALAAGQPRERTVQQLVDCRLLPRWDRYWAEQLLPVWKTETDAGRTPRPPYGPLLRMLKDTPECSSISCDDRTDVHTQEPCPACAMRAEDKRAGWGAARGHAASADDVRDRRDSTPAMPAQRARVVIDHSAGRQPECDGQDGICGRPAVAGSHLCKACLETVGAPF